jgi:hypothetical protein
LAKSLWRRFNLMFLTHFSNSWKSLWSRVARCFFQTRNPNLGKFLKALDWKMLKHFMDIWNILRTFGIFYGHLGYCVTTWNILCSFGTFFLVLVSCTKKKLATLLWSVALFSYFPKNPLFENTCLTTVLDQAWNSEKNHFKQT